MTASEPAVPGRRTAVAWHRVVVFLQENKTTDFYFPSLADRGAVVADGAGLLSAPPNFDQPHDRNAWVHYAMGDYQAVAAQIDNDVVIPFYSYLAKQFVFCDHHFGAGSNSRAGQTVGGKVRKRLACRSAPPVGVERCGGCGDGDVEGGFGVDREAAQAGVAAFGHQ